MRTDQKNKIQSIQFNADEMLIEMDGIQYKVELKNVSSKLLNATNEERMHFEISPSHYGIHWPLIDEDLSIKNLIAIANR